MSRDRHRQTIAALDIARQSRDGFAALAEGDLRQIVAALADRISAPAELTDEAIKVAGLQDIGLLSVDHSTLAAPRRLDDRERNELHKAPIVAHELVTSMPGYERIAEQVLHVHERWDGNGYPDGLRETDIPLVSRIVAVALAFQAMGAQRPYRAAMSPRAISNELEAGAGTQFDPEIVVAMLSLAREHFGE